MSFFSLALGRCAGARDARAAGSPAGFRASGVACGIKPSGAPDLGLLVSDAPETVSAARFTRSGVLAAPVLLCQERCDLAGLRAIVANSGCANAATGRRGLDAATKVQGAGALAARRSRRRRSRSPRPAASRHHLPVDRVVSGVAAAPRRARRRTATSRWPRRSGPPTRSPSACRSRSSCRRARVRVSAQAKGAGMISPAFATMFCFVQTDAALAPETADLLLGVTVKRSFDRISVDGQLSTNDTAILMASGASGVRVEPESEDELRFGETLDALLRQLALMIVRDGEGAERVGPRRRARRPRPARRGRGPRGRQFAAGQGGAARRRPQLGPDRAVRRHGAAGHRAAALRHRDRGRRRSARAASGSTTTRPRSPRPCGATRSSTSSACPARAHETEVFFSDLSHDYVTINAEYTT